MQDYYDILDVAPTATLLEVKQSYRRLVRQHHPDASQQKEDAYIKQVNEAYAVLGNAEIRARYDAHLLETYRKIAHFYLDNSQQTATSTDREKMTWAEGMKGFVQELKKEMKAE